MVAYSSLSGSGREVGWGGVGVALIRGWALINFFRGWAHFRINAVFA